MDWISIALLSTAMMASVSIIDSHILSRRKIGLRAFMLAAGIIQAFYAFGLYLVSPWPADMPAIAVAWVAGASICGMTSTLITLFVLQKEEVSKVVPITGTSPVFVAIIAFFFMNESLGWLQWLSIIVIVAGAIIISSEKSRVQTSGSLKKPFLLLLMASFIGALGNIFTKQALAYISFWNTYGMAILGVSISFLAIAARPSTFRQWRDMKQRNSTIALFFVNEVVALSGSVLFVRAMSLGPVSLVSTISGTRPVLVAVFSMILGLVLPGFLMELPGKKVMALRLLAILMIVGGMSIIYLT